MHSGFQEEVWHNQPKECDHSGKKELSYMMRKHKAKGTFVQRLDHIKAVIQQIWVLSLVNAKKAGKEMDVIQTGAWSARSWSKQLLGTH